MQFTTILHAVRKQFGLSCNEYCIADMIYHLSANPKAPVQGWCNQSRGNMADEMGLSRRTVIDIVKMLTEKGLVERNQTDLLRTTSLWYDAVMAAREGVRAGVQKVHTQTAERCAESAQGVQKVHRGCAETAQDGCAESSHNKESKDKETNKETNPLPLSATPDKKPKAKPDQKQPYRENVTLTATELNTLTEKLGKDFTEQCLDKLSAHKQAKGTTYKSDYGAINSWVIDAVKESQRRNGVIPLNSASQPKRMVI